ncbi:PLP-dependent aminotransferase family protein [Streptomyces sp. 549]|uniref:MocR-like pyridoxine biosynthesis transcription factor PdxR n=1 Tax=Streptomyces sp. 549 TaxID=3049076 RepID=UPI0024C41E36|nr:PLP-dependent aminotransferase family protein [Streptomyces sp. 549]MDK1474092.1 PLP-dependent aminotransferase family protein [Streptomyces sp. 549]
MAPDHPDRVAGMPLALDLDHEDDASRPAPPLHLRLTRALRSAVVGGRFAPGSALPPSRLLAADLGCSRWVVTEAYSQLIAEGYLEARSGSATRVRLGAAAEAGPGRAVRAPDRLPSFDLLPGLPDLSAFPRKRWADAVRAAVGSIPSAALGYPEAAGHPRLREGLAAHLVRARGAALTADHLLVCGGTSDGVARLCRTLRAEGHTEVAVEDPGWPRLSAVVAASGLRPVPVPLDEQGLRVDLLAQLPGVRAAIVAPAHQFPTGVVLSSPRRAALIDWARRVDGLVLEDDYDAEFRYDRRPVGVMQGMDPGRVALLGSVSKTLSPSLRIGWLAAPARWADRVAADEGAPMPPPVIDQEALAEFLAAGSYERHLRASRLRYRRRRDVLVREIDRLLPEHRVSGAAAGFHLMLHLVDCPATEVVKAAARRDVRLVALERYRAGGGPVGDVLVLGYGNLADTAVPGAVQRLAEAVEAVRAGRGGRMD